MNGIVGLFDLQTGRIDSSQLAEMSSAMDYWNPIPLTPSPESAAHPNLNCGSRLRHAQILPNGSWLAAAARIDNREDLATQLGLSAAELAQLDDQALIGHAYLRWGSECVSRIFGDWSFAVWDPSAQRLFLARDHFGNTALYFCKLGSTFAFASSRKALLALRDPAIRKLDDLYIAQVLLSWPVYHGERTAHAAISRLPPAHTLTATRNAVEVSCFWDLEQVQPVAMHSIEEAAEGLLPIFDAAVRARMRTSGSIAVTLSGGLDSGAVAATAVAYAGALEKPLYAYTSVPRGSTAEDVRHRFGDEWELASATALYAGIVNHRPIFADDMTPLAALKRNLWIHDEPQHAASNGYWMLELLRIASMDGCTALLTGQGGNGGLSWTGPAAKFSGGTTSVRHLVKNIARIVLPTRWAFQLRVEWMQRSRPWRRNLAIHPDLVERVYALRASMADRYHPLREEFFDSRAKRLSILKPGRSCVGFLHAENGAATGIEVRDPTLDARVLEYCLSVPERLLVDRSGLDRLLIRTAMKGRLPDSVRLNRRRGLQAADLCMRLRNDRDAMEACLDELDAGPAREYLNMARLRQAWCNVQQQDTAFAFREGSVVLLRAMMAGLFVNQSGGAA